jgi:hypothetical protein
MSSDAKEYHGLCVSSNVQERGDPGGGPELEADYELAGEKMLGVRDEILVLKKAKVAWIPDPADVRAQEVPGEQTTVATATSVGEQVRKTARLFNQHGLPPIIWEGGENLSALEGTRKQFAARQVPAQLRGNFQPGPRREASGAAHPKEPIQGKAGGLRTIKTRESIMLVDRELCGDKEGEGGDSRVPPQNTMESSAPSAKELDLNCVADQAPLQPASVQIEAQAPRAADTAVMPSAQFSGNLYIKAATTSGGMKRLESKTSGNPFERWKNKPVAPPPGEPAPMKAETRMPHLADLLALRIPSQ